jgi:hypothetical protein
MQMQRIFLIIALVLAIAAPGLQAQSPALPQVPDSIQTGSGTALRPHSLGVDLMLSNAGIGIGGFYRWETSADFSMFVDFSVSEAKDANEFQVYNMYGQSITLGKVNRFLVIPLCFGVQQRFFREEILDNFRPYLSAGVGPSMLYVFPENEEFINALGKGHPEYTVGGYIGLGAYFGSDVTNLIGLNLRYYIVPYPAGIEGLEGTLKKDFGGFFITVNIGNAW